MAEAFIPPILTQKHFTASSVFGVGDLLAGARRQKGLPVVAVPAICLLDPDNDLVDHLYATGQAFRQSAWACYHTHLDTFAIAGQEYGIIGRAVGAPFAVLVAEELFASGCQLLISITSAGQILPLAAPPFFLLIEEALRDEGTSYHYLPPASFSVLAPTWRAALREGWRQTAQPLAFGRSWTTDAPFRETFAAVTAARDLNIAAVEMEAAALYAFAAAQQHAIFCFAHITNQLGQGEAEFDKGQANGSVASLAIIAEATRIWQAAHTAEQDHP